MSLAKKLPNIGLAAMAFAAGLNMVEPAFAADSNAALSQMNAQPAAASVLPSKMKLDDCAPKQAIASGLQREGQIPLVVVQAKKISGGGVVIDKEVFTSNSDFSAGYQLKENIKGEYCKAANLYSIRLLNGISNEVDSRAFTQPVSDSSPGTLNGAISAANKKFGEVPLFQAATNAIGSNEKITITVTGQPNGQQGSGTIMLSKGLGRFFASVELAKTEYSSVAKEFISRPIQTAQVDIR